MARGEAGVATMERSARRTLTVDERKTISQTALEETFKKFDFDGSGAIDERELQQAMKLLGVTCSLNTAKKMLRQIDTNSNGLIEWDEFQAFFSRVSDPEDIKHMLSMQCHRFLEYKQAVETDPCFARQFRVPPSVRQMQKFDAHMDSVERVAWLSDDELMSASIDGEVLLWSVTPSPAQGRPKPQRRFQIGRGCALYSMAVDERRRLLVAALDGRGASCLRLCSVDDGSELMAYEGVNVTLYCSAVDGDTIASGSKAGVLAMHNAESPQCLAEIKAHLGVIHSVAFRRGEGNVLCTASKDGSVKIWDARKLDPEGKHDEIIQDAACAGSVLQAIWRNEHEILSCGEDYCIKRWDIRRLNQGPLLSYFGHTSVARAIDVSPDGQLLASGTQCGSTRIWRVDELGTVEARLDEERNARAALSVDLERKEELFEEGSVGVEDLKELQQQLSERQESINQLRESQKALKKQGYTQATVSCDGAKLAISSLAWRVGGVDGRASLAVGSQDQGVYLYRFDVSSL